MGFLYFLLGLILLGLLFQLFFRYILPYILYRYIKKNQPDNPDFNKQKEGEVRINRKSAKQEQVDPNVGEYVDFEEVDDDK